MNNKYLIPAIFISFFSLCIYGCLIRSIHPWLTEETLTGTPILLGFWLDENENEKFFFFNGKVGNYQVLVIEDNEERNLFTANLHKINETLLLVVRPEDKNNWNLSHCFHLTYYSK